MPYLNENFKREIDGYGGFWELCQYLGTLSLKDFAGALNYVVFRTVKTWLKVNGKSYWHLATIIGSLVCCVLEIYRRVVAPYEDEKIADPNHGDIDG